MTTAFSLDARLKLMPKLEGDGFLYAPIVSTAFTLADGTSAGQSNSMWHKELTLAAETYQFLDLTALTVNAVGLSGSLYYASIRYFFVHNASSMASVTVFDDSDGADYWSPLYAVPVVLAPGGTLLAMDRSGWPVTSTSKTIMITNYEENLEFSGTTTNNSKTVSEIADTSTLLVGMVVTGAGIPSGATITSKTASTVILSAEATATAEDVELVAAKPPAVVVVSLAGVLD